MQKKKKNPRNNLINLVWTTNENCVTNKYQMWLEPTSVIDQLKLVELFRPQLSKWSERDWHNDPNFRQKWRKNQFKIEKINIDAEEISQLM